MSKQPTVAAKSAPATRNKKVVAEIRRARKYANFRWRELHDAIWPNDYSLKDPDEKSERIRHEFSHADFAEERLFEYVGGVLRLCRDDTKARGRFEEAMMKLGVLDRRMCLEPSANPLFVLGTEPEIVFITHRQPRPKTDEAKRQRKEERLRRQLDATVGARLRDSLTEPQIVRIVSQDGGEERYDSGEGWRAAYADAADRQRAADRAE